MKLTDLLKDIELGKVYTDKDKPPFKVNEDKDKEGKMAKFDAKETFEDAMDVFKMIDEYDDLPEWLEAKITKASDYMNSVKDYLTHHHSGKNEVDEGIGSLQLETFKVFIKGYKKPFRVAALDARDAKRVAHEMMRNNKVKIQKVVKEEKLSEKFDIKSPGYSSKEAKTVVDGALKNYSKDLKKLQYRVVKDWMAKAKSGVIDYFDLVRGFQTGDAKRAYPYETEFLMSVLSKDKIIDRFRKYFGGKKGKKR